LVIAATALVVAVRSAWIIAEVVVSPHHPSLRLTPIEQYKSGLVGRRERPRFPKAFIATSIIVATATLALVGGGRIAALLVDIAIVAALLSASAVSVARRSNTASPASANPKSARHHRELAPTPGYRSASRRAFAVFRSAVSNPSVNRL
jgi:hypothetical protein